MSISFRHALFKRIKNIIMAGARDLSEQGLFSASGHGVRRRRTSEQKNGAKIVTVGHPEISKKFRVLSPGNPRDSTGQLSVPVRIIPSRTRHFAVKEAKYIIQLVSVVIVNWNRKEYLKRCLESLYKQNYQLIEVIVVDNGSSDGSKELTRDNYPQVTLIENDQNELFCRAQNQGIRKSEGEFILCLNNDVVLDKDFLRQLVEATRRDDMIGMVSGKILSMDGKTIDSAGQFLGKSRKPIERGYRERDAGQFERPGYIFGAGGVAPLYRREMLEDIKIEGEYFDESFEIFYEDLDLAWRAHQRGWKGFYAPGAIAYHLRGGTTKVDSPTIRLLKKYDFTHLPRSLKAHLIKNRYLTMLKNDSVFMLLKHLPFIISYDCKLWGYVLCFEPALFLDAARSLRYVKDTLRKRRKFRISTDEHRWKYTDGHR